MDHQILTELISKYYRIVSSYYYNPASIRENHLQTYLQGLEKNIIQEMRSFLGSNKLSLPELMNYFLQSLNTNSEKIRKNFPAQEMLMNFFDKILNIKNPEFYPHTKNSKFNDGLPYIPTPFPDQLAILNYLPKIINTKTTLVDWGAGAGNFALKIACAYPIKVILVEFEESLVNYARENCQNLFLCKGNIAIIQGDAALLKVPEATIHYLYKPFKRQTLFAWLKNIEKDLVNQQNNYIIYMPAYLVDENQNYFENTPWLKYTGQIPDSLAQIWQVKR